MKFKSKVDYWFYFLAFVLPGAIFIFVVVSIGTSNTTALIILGGSVILTMALPVWLLLSTYYLVEDDVLEIRSGPLKWSIALDEIESVIPGRSMMSSPALSLSQLEIRYGQGKTIFVSPNDVTGFQNSIGQTH